MPAPIARIRKGSKFAFMPDSDRLFVAASERAWMASLSTSELLFEFEKPARFVSRIAVSDDGEIAALAQSCGRVSLYETETGKKLFSRKVGNETDTSGLAFAPRSHDLLHTTWRQLTMVEAGTDGNFLIRPFPVPEDWPDNPMYYAIAFCPAARQFVCVLRQHQTNYATLFDWPLSKELDRLPLQGDNSDPWQSYTFSQVLFTSEDHSFLLTNPDGSVTSHSFTVEVSESTPIDLLAEVTWSEEAIRFFLGDICVSPDGSLLAYKLNGILGIWAWPSGKCLGKWKASGPKPYFDHMGFSNSGCELVISFGGSASGIFIYRTADLISSDLE